MVYSGVPVGSAAVATKKALHFWRAFSSRCLVELAVYELFI